MNYDVYMRCSPEHSAVGQVLARRLEGWGWQVCCAWDENVDLVETEAVRTSELVVFLLDQRVLDRIAREADGPERQLLDQVRSQEKDVLPLWLREDPEGSFNLYHILDRYTGPWMDWLKAQNIVPFFADGDQLDQVGQKLINGLEKVRRTKFEALQQDAGGRKDHITLVHHNKRYRYHGGLCRYNGKDLPYGDGVLEEVGDTISPQRFDGSWDGTESLSGRGTVYRWNGSAWSKLYQGGWYGLLYNDVNGVLFDEQGNKVYQGAFQKGKKCLYGWETGPDGLLFEGWYDDTNGTNKQGELRFPEGSEMVSYQGRSRDWKPDGFGRVFYRDGSIEEGIFDKGALEMLIRRIDAVGNLREHKTAGGNGVTRRNGRGREIVAEGPLQPGHHMDIVKIWVKEEGAANFRLAFTSVKKTEWNKDLWAFFGYGELTYQDGTTYKGEWGGNHCVGMVDGCLTLGEEALHIRFDVLVEGREMDKALRDRLLGILDEEWGLLRGTLPDPDDLDSPESLGLNQQFSSLSDSDEFLMESLKELHKQQMDVSDLMTSNGMGRLFRFYTFCGPDINADGEENWLEGVPREEWLHALFAAPPSRRFQLPWDIQRELGHELSGME